MINLLPFLLSNLSKPPATPAFSDFLDDLDPNVHCAAAGIILTEQEHSAATPTANPSGGGGGTLLVFFWLPPSFCNLLAASWSVVELYWLRERLSKALRTFLKRDETLQNIDFRSANLPYNILEYSYLPTMIEVTRFVPLQTMEYY